MRKITREDIARFTKARLEPDPRQRLGRLFKKANGAGWDRVRTAFELALRRGDDPGLHVP